MSTKLSLALSSQTIIKLPTSITSTQGMLQESTTIVFIVCCIILVNMAPTIGPLAPTSELYEQIILYYYWSVGAMAYHFL